MDGNAMDTAALNELAAIETDTRFFMRLLIAAGIVAAAAVAGGVVWHVTEFGGGAGSPAPTPTHIEQTRQGGQV